MSSLQHCLRIVALCFQFCTHNFRFIFFLFILFITYNFSVQDQGFVWELEGRVELLMTGMFVLRAVACMYISISQHHKILWESPSSRISSRDKMGCVLFPFCNLPFLDAFFFFSSLLKSDSLGSGSTQEHTECLVISSVVFKGVLPPLEWSNFPHSQSYFPPLRLKNKAFIHFPVATPWCSRQNTPSMLKWSHLLCQAHWKSHATTPQMTGRPSRACDRKKNWHAVN